MLLLSTSQAASLPVHDVMGTNLPKDTMCLHPVQFAFSLGSAITGHPEACTAKALCGMMVKEGFISVYGPLWLDASKPLSREADEERVPSFIGNDKFDAFNVHYVKGSARATTLLCICAMFIQDAVNMKEVLRVPQHHPQPLFFALHFVSSHGVGFACRHACLSNEIHSGKSASGLAVSIPKLPRAILQGIM